MQMGRRRGNKATMAESRKVKDEAEDKEEEGEDAAAEGEYEVEKIIFHKKLYKKHFYYYVKWKGYDDGENTWEPKENLEGCCRLRDDYHATLESLARENCAEYKLHVAASELCWKKSRKSVPRGDPGGIDGDDGDSADDQTAPKAIEERSEGESASADVATNGKKRKSEDDDDDGDEVDPSNAPDPEPKKVKLTTKEFMKNWLERGSTANVAAQSTKPEVKTTIGASTNQSTSPSVRKTESEAFFHRLFKRPNVGGGKAEDCDKVDAAERKRRQSNELKGWENEMNSVCKDPGKIVVENQVDDDGPPKNFRYINNYLPRNDIVFPDDPLMGCQCAECDVKNCCPQQNEAKMAYSKYKRLREGYSPALPIYECNKLCRCGPDCRNRVVQRGRQFKLCIFKTDNGRGWGVKTQQNIKAGTYVTTYLGELIDHEEAERRGKEYDQVGMTYLFDLDYAGLDTCFTIDAARYGNVSHFINHSCDPNLQVCNVFIDNIDIQFPYLCLFASRDIAKDEELTFDYQMSGATELEESTIEPSALGNVSLSESRYDADRSGEDSEFLISADDQSMIQPTVDQSPKRRMASDSVFFTPVDKENVSPPDDNGPSSALAASPSKALKRTSPTTHLAASTPRKMTPKKALDKKTPCLCGTVKCRGFLMT